MFHCCTIKITGLLVNIKRNSPNPLLFNLRTANLKSSHSHLSSGYKFVCSLTHISLLIQRHNLLGLQALCKMTYVTRIKENDELLKYLPTMTRWPFWNSTIYVGSSKLRNPMEEVTHYRDMSCTKEPRWGRVSELVRLNEVSGTQGVAKPSAMKWGRFWQGISESQNDFNFTLNWGH